MRILAFDTSGPALSAAATEGGRLLAWHREDLPRGHAERLLPALTDLLAEAGWRWAEVELVAVTQGPGNFTGLRAGIAVARALGLALGIPVLGLGTLEVMAHGSGSGGPSVAVLDARRGEAYAQRFAADLAPETAPELVPVALLLPDGYRLIDAGPDALALASLAAARLAAGVVPGPGTALRPLYLRPPDARLGAGASLLPAAG